MSAEIVLFLAVAVYGAAGLAVGAAFVTVAAGRVLSAPGASQPVSFTFGARLLILPGAAALWPYVLLRWRRALRQP
ncbi:MAG: hypothetical protein FJX62_13075 [Alphaproteobacteria bacterium]|nr:hypothetical protein [Alphaproteobacteria bacterium]